ncbi:zinc-binding alcohol dehydrogenase family protein [Bacillus sp. 03113]|uniref:zinc-binding alcohol dehydrogenase family protein n=1 Tax=Bacillus sp. 03113 TaxID=2578211 RepID=UPI0011445738|nr:zinc-binding alcohol dehydrogenase family protein [Bacillus sp. 03113]
MSNHQTMKAVGFYRSLPLSDPESLMDIEIEKPIPTGRDILVEVKAISVNPADVRTRSRKIGGENTPTILGWDVAGVVEQIGPDCTLFKPGDEVYYAGSLTRPGANSEYHLVDEQIVGKKPNSLDFAQAAALPLTFLTAWEALYERLGISHNEQENQNKTILIIGAAGGVGSIATQLAKLAGMTVIGTSSRVESSQWAKDLGADFIINHKEDIALQLKEIGFEVVDYIFCLNDTAGHWKSMVNSIAPQGKICLIVPAEKPLDMDVFLFKSVTVVWELMFTKSMYQTKDMIEQHNLLNELANLIDTGKVKTTIGERIQPIHAANLRLVHEKIGTGSTIGKIVLENFVK